MAIYHFSAKIISRGKGQSAVGSAAYRRGAVLQDERTGVTHNYGSKEEVAHSEIVIPNDAPVWVQEMATLQTTNPNGAAERLWNQVEAFENRKDSVLSREIELALPIELPLEQNISLVRSFIQEQFCQRGMVADFNVHWVSGNPHVHIMLTTRFLKENGFGPKVLDWNDKSLLRTWRQAWAEHTNRVLALEGYDSKIDHRSYVDQGIDLIPTKHEGPMRHLEAKGIQTTCMIQNQAIRELNLQMIAKCPELLLKKIGNGYRSFGVKEVVNGVAAYANGKESVSLVSDKVWTGTRQEIEAIFRIVAKNEAVFQEKALYSVLSKVTPDAEAAAKALVQLKASSELMAIGPGEDGRERYTTRAVFDLENALQDLADELVLKNNHQVKKHIISKTIRQFKLKDDQAKAVHHVLSGSDIVAVVGLAGSGKTYSLKAANAAWETAGFRVHGVALSGVATDGLSDAGIKSRTIASFCEALGAGTLVLKKSDVVVMDEAGMTDSLNFFDVLLAVRQAKAKLVLVGDPAQLQPIGFGAPFRALIERIGFAELTTIRRQAESWQREASFKFAKGDIEGAIEAYHTRGCVKILRHAEETLVADWHQAISTGKTTLKESLMLAYRNADVTLLNQLARAQRVAQGELSLGVAVRSAKGEIFLSVGDRVIFLENNWFVGVRNGNRGTLVSLAPNAMQVQLDNGKTIEFNPNKYPNFDYGYASTVHKAQGVTVDHTFVLAAGRWVSNLVYVAMTRHRQSATLYASQETYASISLLKKAMSRQEIKDSVLDYPLAFAARRGVEIETILHRFSSHIKTKLIALTASLKAQFQEVFNAKAYWEQKALVVEKDQKIQDIVSRRQDATQVAAYIDANRTVGQTFEKVSEHPKAFQEAYAKRNLIAAGLWSNKDRYARAIAHYGISLEKLEKQSLAHQARLRVEAYIQEKRSIYSEKIAYEIQKDIKSHYLALMTHSVSLGHLKTQAKAHEKRININSMSTKERQVFRQAECFESEARLRVLAFKAQVGNMKSRISLAQQMVANPKVHYCHTVEQGIDWKKIIDYARYGDKIERLSLLSDSERQDYLSVSHYQALRRAAGKAWGAVYAAHNTTGVEVAQRISAERDKAAFLLKSHPERFAAFIEEKSISSTELNKCAVQHEHRVHMLANLDKAHQDFKDASHTQHRLWDVDVVFQALECRAADFTETLLGSPNQRLSTADAYRYGKKGSLVVNIKGEKAGLWYDFEKGEGGHLLQLVQSHCGYEFKEALKYAAEYTGIAPESHKPKERLPKAPQKIQGFSDKQKEMIAYAKKLEQECTPIKGTLAEEYLREHRGIKTPISDSFKFNIAVKEPETQRYLPALIVVAKDKEGETQAVQCVFLDIRTANKASIETPKRTYGPLKGASVLVQQGKDRVALAEGPETALSVASADSTLTVYATLGISNMAKIPLPDTITRVTLCADNDGVPSPSHQMLITAAEKLSKRGLDVSIAAPSSVGQDFNDVLKEKGVSAVLSEINQAICVKSAARCEFKEKMEEHQYTPDNRMNAKLKLYRELLVMAHGIKNDPELTETAKRYGVYPKVVSYAAAYEKTLQDESQSQKILAKLKSKNPIQEYISMSEKQKNIPAPWLNSTREQKTEWRILNAHLQKLGFAINKDLELSAQAIEKGIYKDVQNKSSSYYITLRDQQSKDRGIER